MTSSQVPSKVFNQYPTIFNLNDYKTKTGLVNFQDLLEYGNLYANNVWKAYNQFTSIFVQGTINGVSSSFLTYIQYLPSLIIETQGISYEEVSDTTRIDNNLVVEKELKCDRINGIENWNYLSVTEPIQSALTSIRNSISSILLSITNTNLDLESVRTSLTNLANSLSSYSFQNNSVKISSDIELKDVSSSNISASSTLNARKLNCDSIFTNQVKSKLIKTNTILCDQIRSKNEIGVWLKINSETFPLLKDKVLTQLTNESITSIRVSLKPNYRVTFFDSQRNVVQQELNQTDDILYNIDVSLQTNKIKIIMIL